MADKAREWTDAHLREMEKHLKSVYTQAQSEITDKWRDYMARGEDRLQDLHHAWMTAPADQKAAMLRRYQDALRAYTLQNKWYRDMVDTTTYRLAHVNEIAIAYVNGEIPKVYAQNFNYLDPDALLIKSNWTLRNEEMVRNLMIDSLPQKTLNIAKDMAWNTKQINNAVLQGILQGEGIPKIAKRIVPIVDNNRAAAVRTARTMVTGAENKGRQDRYAEYTEEGLVIHKVWIATPDHRVRNWHLDMDGQEVPENETFTDGLGQELMYPGDPGAPANTVYNCRCSMRSHILGVKRHGRFTPMKEYRTEKTYHEKQINTEREIREEMYG